MAVAIILIGLILFFRDQTIMTFLEKEKENEKKLFVPQEYTYIKEKEEREKIKRERVKRTAQGTRIKKPKLRRI